jgi:uncharacterized OsmC-like protein
MSLLYNGKKQETKFKSEDAMKLQVKYEGKKRFKAIVRDHEFTIDLPEKKGGDNSGPTPPEVFIASLASCIGLFAIGYMNVAKLNTDGLAVEVDWSLSEDHTRVDKIDAKVIVPNAELGKRERALHAAVEKCIIHNTLHTAPEMNIEIVNS